MKRRFTILTAAIALLFFMMPALTVDAAEGDELAICQGTGSGYGTRRTLTDSHNVGWVLASGQTGYLGTNNATNHGNVHPTDDDIPVVKAVNQYTYTSTTGYYYYYTTTPVENVGSIEFSYTANSGNTTAKAYVVVGDALAVSGGNPYSQIALATSSTSEQGVSLGSSGTFTFTFEETQTSARYYGVIIQTNSYKRMTNGTIKLLEGSTISGPTHLAAPALTATPSNEKVTLTWNNVNGASSYTIQYADNSSFTGATTITNATSPKEISGLTNGTTYYFKAMSVGDGIDYISSDYGTAVSATPDNIATITIAQDDIDGFTNVYAWYDWSDGEVSGKLYAYKNGGMQFNSSKEAYWIYNTTAIPGNITSVKITKASGTDRSWTLKAGNSVLTTTSGGTQIGNAQTVGTDGATWNVSGGYSYFLLYVSGGSTVISSIEITYTPTSASDPSISADDVNLAYDATSGLIEGEIENYVEGTISASTEASWISNFTYDQADEFFEIGFTTTANPSVSERNATVVLTYTYGNSTITKNVVVTQVGNPNAPGTVNNPYTVAQAIANTPSSGDVYIQGIVSSFYNTSIVGDGSNYRYRISDDGTTTTELLVYKGKGLNQTTFTNANDLLVGDEVVICGTLNMYNNAPQVASGNYLYSWNRPAAAVEAPTFNPAAGTFTTAQNVTLSCATTGADIYYTTDGTEPTSASTPYTSAIAVSTTTTIKAIAYVGNAASTVATATYHFCSANDPYTVTEALAFNEYPANGIYVHGIVSTAPTSLSNGTLTYYISVDGNATNQLEVYKGKDIGNENFTSVDDIQVGDIVTVYGNIQIYNSTFEFAQGNYLVSFERPTTPAQEYTLTVDDPAHVTFTVGYGTDGALTNGENDDIEEGTLITLTVTVEAGYLLGGITVTGENSQSVTVTETSTQGVYTFNMPAFNATISATTIVAPATTTYTLATSIESGKQYIIVGQDEGVYYAMGSDRGNNRSGVIITISGTTATATVENNAVHEFTITSLGTENHYSIMDATTSGGYLYAASSSNNYLKTESALDNEGNGDWEITIDAGVFSVVASGNYTHKYMRFNNAQDLFSCYEQGKQHPVYLYVKDETPAPQTYTKTILPYSQAGYYLIASPIGTVNPTQVTNMITDPIEDPEEAGHFINTYDLFSFDQAQDLEWRNYRATNDGFNLEVGKGYLYANRSRVDLEFTGTAYSSNGQVTLSKTDNTSADFPGWNLVGNPFPVLAYINKPYYKMNASGTQIVAITGNSVQDMEGIFVVAETDGETMTFSTTAPAKKCSNLALNLTEGGSLIDRAIVVFSESEQLPKFQLDRNSTKLYIPQDGQDYAVVCSEEMGETPVSFEAEKNGTYTMSFSMENVEFGYLHLIDNLTGKDIDLLQTPSYSFEARTTDYANRFKLVYATGSADSSDTFAFFSNGSFVINNEGEATLQVIDVTGRIVKSESVNGCTNVSVNAAPGVYMLRLVNGDNVKTQKVVVR